MRLADQGPEQNQLHLQEEHRLAYVAMTRARDNLILTFQHSHSEDAEAETCAMAQDWENAAFRPPADFVRRIKAVGLPHVQVSTHSITAAGFCLI